jgi:surface antigen
MATTRKTLETIPVGTDVTWHYRSAIGHGTVTGVHKLGTTADNTMYSVRQHDHHPGEPSIVHHTGKALTIVQA